MNIDNINNSYGIKINCKNYNATYMGEERLFSLLRSNPSLVNITDDVLETIRREYDYKGVELKLDDTLRSIGCIINDEDMESLFHMYGHSTVVAIYGSDTTPDEYVLLIKSDCL